ncbi:unnamed protein product [Didymodactylos carnosus]|uniref:Dynamin N-terminal domain-containing protein n=1 Tax=Didymodactylos carnosus TaxID=1234261 RepID=A0A815H2U5_9BILA|nr:unnamed protein product [Didymodactylos carnosus]CAF1509230.1 unnamed protein product [Didymodactylos carnosus]CAF4212296.1 unnamed protein product [Didymodactylos carnosus]CAF4297247.1 unnamed protein product [Didymodactylos carnosus]
MSIIINTLSLQKHENLAYQILSILNYNDKNANNIYSNNIEKIINGLLLERHNVTNLELRMKIVAPMKAGKSTTINALIGDNILPTRGDVMSTLPTEVVFKRGINVPTLTLSEEGIGAIINLQEEIRNYLKINATDIKSLENILDSHAHLVKMGTAIRDNNSPGFILSINIVGTTQIQEALKNIY